MTVPTEPVLVVRTIEQVTRSLKAGRSGRVEIEDPTLTVAAEPVYLHQVLRNVIGNTEKYADTDALAPAERTAGEVVISVLDRCPGVPTADLERIFERVFRGEKNAKRGRGAGLGLTVCRRLMEAQSGRIWAENRHEGGLAVHMALPAVDLAEQA